MRRALIVLPAVAVTVAGVALGACGSGKSDGASGAAPSGHPQPGQSGAPQARPDLSAVISQALDPLVADGTITATQEVAVADAFDAGVGGGPPQAGPPPEGAAPEGTHTPDAGRQPPQPGDVLATLLDPLVEDGTLASAQASAVSRAIAEAMPQGPAARAPPASQGSTSSMR